MSNPIRTCPICAKTDDHPRHVIAIAGALDAQGEQITVAYHMDCCAMTTDCEVCKAQLEGVGGVAGNPKGEKLREHLLTTGPAPDQPGWTAPTYETPVELVAAPATTRKEG